MSVALCNRRRLVDFRYAPVANDGARWCNMSRRANPEVARLLRLGSWPQWRERIAARTAGRRQDALVDRSRAPGATRRLATIVEGESTDGWIVVITVAILAGWRMYCTCFRSRALEVLDLLSLDGCVVTADALHRHRSFAAAVLERRPIIYAAVGEAAPSPTPTGQPQRVSIHVHASELCRLHETYVGE